MPKRIIEDIDPGSDLEVSWVRRGANPMAKVFLKKSADQPQPEKLNMALKSVLLAETMATPVGAALLKSFTTDAELDTFLAKDDAGRAADLTAFAKAKGMPADLEDKLDGGKDDDKEDANGKLKKAAEGAAPVVKAEDIAAIVAKALSDSPVLADLRKENAELKTRLEKSAGETREAQLRKHAEGFSGNGLSVEQNLAVFKALEDDSHAEVRKHIEQVFKAHAELAARVARAAGFIPVGKDASSATAQLRKMAEDVAKAENLLPEVAFAKVCDNPANAELVEKADREELEARAA